MEHYRFDGFFSPKRAFCRLIVAATVLLQFVIMNTMCAPPDHSLSSTELFLRLDETAGTQYEELSPYMTSSSSFSSSPRVVD